MGDTPYSSISSLMTRINSHAIALLILYSFFCIQCASGVGFPQELDEVVPEVETLLLEGVMEDDAPRGAKNSPYQDAMHEKDEHALTAALAKAHLFQTLNVNEKPLSFMKHEPE